VTHLFLLPTFFVAPFGALKVYTWPFPYLGFLAFSKRAPVLSFLRGLLVFRPSSFLRDALVWPFCVAYRFCIQSLFSRALRAFLRVLLFSEKNSSGTDFQYKNQLTFFSLSPRHFTPQGTPFLNSRSIITSPASTFTGSITNVLGHPFRRTLTI